MWGYSIVWRLGGVCCTGDGGIGCGRVFRLGRGGGCGERMAEGIVEDCRGMWKEYREILRRLLEGFQELCTDCAKIVEELSQN